MTAKKRKKIDRIWTFMRKIREKSQIADREICNSKKWKLCARLRKIQAINIKITMTYLAEKGKKKLYYKNKQFQLGKNSKIEGKNCESKAYKS